MQPTVLITAHVLSIIAFLGYGLACFFSRSLIAEFERWGCGSLRKLTGGLQVLGALGLLAGLRDPFVRMISASGLAFMMACAVVVRLRVRDPLIRWIPALVLLLVNVLVALL